MEPFDILDMLLHGITIYMLYSRKEKRVGRRFEFKLKKYNDFSESIYKPLPSVPPELELKFFQKVLASDDYKALKFTETAWMNWWRTNDGTPKNFRIHMTRCERDGILRREKESSAKNITRVLADGWYGKVRRKVRKLTSSLPQPPLPPKQAENTSKK